MQRNDAPSRRASKVGPVCAVVRDPAAWAWLLVVLLALLPLREAFAQDIADADDEGVDAMLAAPGVVPGMMLPGMAMPGMASRGGATQPVQRLTDNDMDCEAIYVEVKSLEKANAARQAEIDASTKTMVDAAHEMASSGRAAGSVASGVGILSSVAGLVPGIGGMVGGMVSGAVGSAAAAAASASMRSQQKAMMDGQMRLVRIAQEQAYGTARARHLTSLFLKRPCKASEVEAALKNKERGGVAVAAAPAAVTEDASQAASAAAGAPATSAVN